MVADALGCSVSITHSGPDSRLSYLLIQCSLPSRRPVSDVVFDSVRTPGTTPHLIHWPSPCRHDSSGHALHCTSSSSVHGNPSSGLAVLQRDGSMRHACSTVPSSAADSKQSTRTAPVTGRQSHNSDASKILSEGQSNPHRRLLRTLPRPLPLRCRSRENGFFPRRHTHRIRPRRKRRRRSKLQPFSVARNSPTRPRAQNADGEGASRRRAVCLFLRAYGSCQLSVAAVVARRSDIFSLSVVCWRSSAG